MQIQNDEQGQYGNNSHTASASELNDIDVLVRNYRLSVLRYVLMQIRDIDLAETITQDCLMRAFRSRGNFRGGCSVRTWLITIATNLIRDYTRTKRFRFWKEAGAVTVELSDIQDHLAGHQQSPEARLLVKEQLERIWSVVDSLPKTRKEVFLMRFVEEMKLSEIARATGMTISEIKAHLYSGVRMVRAREKDQTQLDRGEATVRECLPSCPSPVTDSNTTDQLSPRPDEQIRAEPINLHWES